MTRDNTNKNISEPREYCQLELATFGSEGYCDLAIDPTTYTSDLDLDI